MLVAIGVFSRDPRHVQYLNITQYQRSSRGCIEFVRSELSREILTTVQYLGDALNRNNRAGYRPDNAVFLRSQTLSYKPRLHINKTFERSDRRGRENANDADGELLSYYDYA